MMTQTAIKNITSKSLIYLVCILMAVVILMPLLLVLLTSFKSVSESAVIGLSLPETFHLENFPYVIREGKLIRAFLNSLFITGTSVLFTVLLGSLTAFIITRRTDKASKFFFGYFLIGLIAPVALIPEVLIVKMLGLSGTYAAIILIHIAVRLPLSIMLYSGFVKGVPKSLDESAMLDGCNPIKMFAFIVFPLLKPVIFTNVILTFMAVWNDFQISLYFITDTMKSTLPKIGRAHV